MVTVDELTEGIKNLTGEAKELGTEMESLLKTIEDGTVTSDVVDALSEKLDKFKRLVGDSELVNRFSASLEVAEKKLRSLGEISAASTKKLSEFFNQSPENLSNLMSSAKRRFEEGEGAIAQTAAVTMTMLNPALTESSKLFGDIGDRGMEAGRKLNEAGIAKLAEKMKIPEDRVRELIRLQEATADLETAVIKQSIASGSANEIMENGVLSTEKASMATASFIERTKEIADATGMSKTAITPFLLDFERNIPAAFRSSSEAMGDMSSTMDDVVRMIKIADGIGISHSDIQAKIKESYLNWNNSIDKTLGNLALMNRAMQDMEITQDTMLGFLSNATSGMETMADATESAIDMMRSLGRVMRDDLGMSEAGVSKILGGMVEGVKGMDISQAAVVNQMAGGRGGLAGGFEMALLKQQGDVGEMTNRVMKAMEKMGVGSPVTLQDVQSNPALAGMLLQQREMIKQFGLARTDDDAYRVLELMQQGGQERLETALSEIKDPQTAMMDLTKTSNEISKLQLQSLKTLENRANDIAQTMAINVRGGVKALDTKIAEGVYEATGVSIGDVALEEGAPATTRSIYSGMHDRQSLTENTVEMMKTGASATMDIAKHMKDNLTGITLPEMSPGESTAMPPENRRGGDTVFVDGIIKAEIDIKDGVKTIATETFEARMKDLNQGAFTGNTSGG